MMNATLKAHTNQLKRNVKKIPDFLIREVMDGQPLYYRGYRDVLRKLKTIEDIMPCSTLQATIVYYINRHIIKSPLDDAYYVHTSESGLHLSHGNNLGGDVVLFDKKVLSPDQVNEKFASVSPHIIFEIDVKIDLANMTEFAYIHKKTQKLLDFGVKKVFWITSSTKKVMLAEQGNDWRIIDWHKDIEIQDGVFFNVGKYLEERGIDVGVPVSTI